MSDCEKWIEAAVAHQGRAERAEHDLAAARARLERLEKALQEIATAPVSECFGYMRCADRYVHPHVVHVAKTALSPTPETKP